MPKLKIIMFIAINALFLAVITVFAVNYQLMGTQLHSQSAAERWAGSSEDHFSQISCFFPVGKGLNTDSVYSIRTAVDGKLQAASLEAPEGGALWTDAYSAQGELIAVSELGNSKVKAIGVGGNYFLFHNLRLLSGGYISGDDLMKDRVVLDRTLAWKLFGSTELMGMEIIVNGSSFLIAGVIEAESDSFSRRVYGENPVLYMSYEAFSNMGEASILCYEAVLPNQITGSALDIITSSLPAPDDAEIIENSTRFTFERSFTHIRDFGSRSILEHGMIYPYWENAARLVEDYMALFLAFIILFGIIPFLSLLFILVRIIRLFNKNKKRIFGAIVSFFEKRIEEKRRQKYLQSNHAGRDGNPELLNAKSGTSILSPENANEEAIIADIEAVVKELMDENR